MTPEQAIREMQAVCPHEERFGEKILEWADALSILVSEPAQAAQVAGRRQMKNGTLACPYCEGTGRIADSFARRMTHSRKKKGFTQDELSKLVGVTRSQVANIESGRHDPTATFLLKLSDAIGVSIDWLLRGDADPIPAKDDTKV